MVIIFYCASLTSRFDSSNLNTMAVKRTDFVCKILFKKVNEPIHFGNIIDQKNFSYCTDKNLKMYFHTISETSKRTGLSILNEAHLKFQWLVF